MTCRIEDGRRHAEVKKAMDAALELQLRAEAALLGETAARTRAEGALTREVAARQAAETALAEATGQD